MECEDSGKRPLRLNLCMRSSGHYEASWCHRDARSLSICRGSEKFRSK